jgi:hypothetical protein
MGLSCSARECREVQPVSSAGGTCFTRLLSSRRDCSAGSAARASGIAAMLLCEASTSTSWLQAASSGGRACSLLRAACSTCATAQRCGGWVGRGRVQAAPGPQRVAAPGGREAQPPVPRPASPSAGAPAGQAPHLQRPEPRHLRGQRHQLVPAQVELRQAAHLPNAGRQAAELVAVQQQHRQAGQRRELPPGHAAVAQPVGAQLEGLQAGERAQGWRQAGQLVVAQVGQPRAGQALQQGGRQLSQAQVPAGVQVQGAAASAVAGARARRGVGAQAGAERPKRQT